jgi:capsular polysaccharide export protein
MQPRDGSSERTGAGRTVGRPGLAALQDRRSFLFLQGPLSPLYARVADRLEAGGHNVSRINLCIGDRMHWRRAGAVNYRGRIEAFGDQIRRHIATHGVTDIVMHGECRAYHRIAAEAAGPAGVRVFVTELGYLRPDWMAVDRDGTAAASIFPRDPRVIARLAERSAPVDLAAQYPSHFSWVAIPDVVYNLANTLLWFFHPYFQRHTIDWPPLEYAAWVARLATARARNRRAAGIAAELIASGRPYFVFPLQLEGDFQVRARSPFKGQAEAIESVMASFAAHAPPDARLVLKTHPLDNGLIGWRRIVDETRARHGMAGRVLFLDGGGLAPMLERARGVVTINSSAGLEAILTSIPVKTLAPALYDVAGLTHQGVLATFWNAPHKPDAVLAGQFVRALGGSVLVRGTIYSREGLDAAVRNVADAILTNRPERTIEDAS